MYIKKTLEKFYENKEYKYFPGNTIIHFLDNKDQIKIICELKKEMEKNSLFEKFVFLPENSYHMTVCDIVTYKNLKDDNKYKFDSSSNLYNMDKQIASFLKDTIYDLNIKMVPKKIKAKKIVLEPKTDLDAKKLSEFRSFVASKIGIQLPNNYTFHISLAYQLKELNEKETEEMDKFLEILNNKYLHLLNEINVNKAYFVLFNDMYAYGLIENGRLNLGVTNKYQEI